MEVSMVTIKGQVVIPAKIRQNLGIKKGTKVGFIQKGEEIVLYPITKAYFEKTAGLLKRRGGLTKKLLQERARDRKRENL